MRALKDGEVDVHHESPSDWLSLVTQDLVVNAVNIKIHEDHDSQFKL